MCVHGANYFSFLPLTPGVNPRQDPQQALKALLTSNTAPLDATVFSFSADYWDWAEKAYVLLFNGLWWEEKMALMLAATAPPGVEPPQTMAQWLPSQHTHFDFGGSSLATLIATTLELAIRFHPRYNGAGKIHGPFTEETLNEAISYLEEQARQFNEKTWQENQALKVAWYVQIQFKPEEIEEQTFQKLSFINPTFKNSGLMATTPLQRWHPWVINNWEKITIEPCGYAGAQESWVLNEDRQELSLVGEATVYKLGDVSFRLMRTLAAKGTDVVSPEELILNLQAKSNYPKQSIHSLVYKLRCREPKIARLIVRLFGKEGYALSHPVRLIKGRRKVINAERQHTVSQPRQFNPFSRQLWSATGECTELEPDESEVLKMFLSRSGQTISVEELNKIPGYYSLLKRLAIKGLEIEEIGNSQAYKLRDHQVIIVK